MPQSPASDLEALRTTLLELVQSVQEHTRSVDETTAVVTDLVNTGKALLIGTFAGATFVEPVTPSCDDGDPARDRKP